MADQLLNTLAVTKQIKSELGKSRSVKIAMPYITCPGLGLLLDRIQQSSPKKGFHLQLLTRFDAESILAGACELEALEELFRLNLPNVTVEVKRRDNLHAKCFVFDERSLIVGSSNMTQAGQISNIELGFYSSSRAVIKNALSEFNDYWQKALPLDVSWVQDQKAALEPFVKRYQSLRSEIRGFMILQSLRMPGAEGNFLMSLKQILKKAKLAKGFTRTWLEQEMRKAAQSSLTEDEPSLNVNKRIGFLKVLGLVEEKDGSYFLTALGQECYTDNKKLLGKMAVTFPILSSSYQAIPRSGLCRFKDISRVDPVDPEDPTEPSQTLRNAVHWLAAFGILNEERVGNLYQFERRRSTLARLL